MVVKPCEYCGQEFDAESVYEKDRRRGKLKRFCSRRCRNLSRPKLPEKPIEHFNRICGHCGQQFDATPSRPKYEKPRKYCRGCVREGRKQTFAMRNAHLSETRTCEVCSKQFAVPIRVIRSGKNSGKFCSTDCCYASRRGISKPFGQPREVGATRINPKGYVEIKVASGKWALEHRHVMEQILGRQLLQNESPHHKNGNRADNRPENLELWVKVQPSGQRVSDLIAYVVEYHCEALLQALSHRPT